MCGRYTLYQIEQLQKRFDTENAVEVKPNYNASPTQMMPVVTMNSPKRLELMYWSLIPRWEKSLKLKYSTYNARDDNIGKSPVFKPAFHHHRCLVPVSGYFEWKHVGSRTEPHYFRMKNQGIFALAGLYSMWMDTEGNELGTYTIITTSPNEMAKPIHDRMPCILRRDDESRWLDHSTKSDDELYALLHPYSEDEMEEISVEGKVNELTPEWRGFVSELNSK